MLTVRSFIQSAKRHIPITRSGRIQRARAMLARRFVRGIGVEVGAGNRPFPLPKDAQCAYGDIRDKSELTQYFRDPNVSMGGRIDAQTMSGISPGSLDFVISAHVIEHLFDPVGAITTTLRCLKNGGVFLLVVPEMSKTFDRARPPTTLDHVIQDSMDQGEGTRLIAYIEHYRFIHPVLTGQELTLDEIAKLATSTMERNADAHVHAWREQDFFEMLQYIQTVVPCAIEVRYSVGDENAYALRRL